jgi:hypothetical protein
MSNSVSIRELSILTLTCALAFVMGAIVLVHEVVALDLAS